MNFQKVRTMIDAILSRAATGVKLPAETTEQSLEKDLEICLAAAGITIAEPKALSNRPRILPGSRRTMSNPARRGKAPPTDEQIREAATKFFGVTPRKPA